MVLKMIIISLLQIPYDCKNGDFDAIEELLLVRGVTPDIYYGGLKNMVTAFRDSSSSLGKMRRRSRKSSGAKICINAAPKAVLLSLPQMTEDLAQSIVDFEKMRISNLWEKFPRFWGLIYMGQYPAILH
jgi:general secretion pathway protein K